MSIVADDSQTLIESYVIEALREMPFGVFNEFLLLCVIKVTRARLLTLSHLEFHDVKIKRYFFHSFFSLKFLSLYHHFKNYFFIEFINIFI